MLPSVGGGNHLLKAGGIGVGGLDIDADVSSQSSSSCMQVRFEPPLNTASANAAATAAAGSKLLSEAEATPCKQMNLLPDTLIKVQQVRNSLT